MEAVQQSSYSCWALFSRYDAHFSKALNKQIRGLIAGRRSGVVWGYGCECNLLVLVVLASGGVQPSCGCSSSFFCLPHHSSTLIQHHIASILFTHSSWQVQVLVELGAGLLERQGRGSRYDALSLVEALK